MLLVGTRNLSLSFFCHVFLYFRTQVFRAQSMIRRKGVDF
ncbi:hypothetical protein C943_01314 [Mariniradius saccharolyticus AK6]|uniref:Uncharacterized protein n=1 Tax=Mariniradius saccharolyticus AK6 TaxID=1239962 RepID=M7XVR4_9BACT|nr:hypothetical protein C943_01314 [Mariniradius saccharolyticus AK6]